MSDQREHAIAEVIAELAGPRHLNTRRERTYPRAVKRARHNYYPVRKPGQHGTRHKAPATIKIANPVLTRKKTRIAALPQQAK